jgi:hypothetical protein
MYPQDTYPPYPQDTYGTRLLLKVCLSYFSFLLPLFDRIRVRNTWTKINKEMKPSSGNGRFPKRIGPDTRLNRGMANIAGFDLPILCVWSNTGVDCNLTRHSAVRLRSSRPGLLGAGAPKAKPADNVVPADDTEPWSRCWSCDLPGDDADRGPVSQDHRGWLLHFSCRVELQREIAQWRGR